MPWTRHLSRPVHTRSGATLRTLDDARRYLLALPDAEGLRPAWQSAAGPLGAAAECGTPDAIEAATEQVERALLLCYQLDLHAPGR